jgi:hypothetical protein
MSILTNQPALFLSIYANPAIFKIAIAFVVVQRPSFFL